MKLPQILEHAAPTGSGYWTQDELAAIRAIQIAAARAALEEAAKVCEQMAPGGRFLNAGKYKTLLALTEASATIRAIVIEGKA